jgi:hypothetical protein
VRGCARCNDQGVAPSSTPPITLADARRLADPDTAEIAEIARLLALLNTYAPGEFATRIEQLEAELAERVARLEAGEERELDASASTAPAAPSL